MQTGLIKNIAIVVMAGVILYLLFHKKEPITETQTITTVDTVYRDNQVIKIKHIPKLITEKIIDVQNTVDTVYIIQEYNTKKYYSDKIDTMDCHIVIDDTIYHNSIVSRNISVSNKRETIINTTIQNINEMRNKGFIGVNSGVVNNEFGYGVGIGMQDKRDNIYSADIINSKNGVSIMGSVKLKIRLK